MEDDDLSDEAKEILRNSGPELLQEAARCNSARAFILKHAGCSSIVTDDIDLSACGSAHRGEKIYCIRCDALLAVLEILTTTFESRPSGQLLH